MTENLELNLGKILEALLKTHGSLEIDPIPLTENSKEKYQLVLEFNEDSEKFEISLEVDNAS